MPLYARKHGFRAITSSIDEASKQPPSQADCMVEGVAEIKCKYSLNRNSFLLVRCWSLNISACCSVLNTVSVFWHLVVGVAADLDVLASGPVHVPVARRSKGKLALSARTITIYQ